MANRDDGLPRSYRCLSEEQGANLIGERVLVGALVVPKEEAAV
jgi:hypothetical protein